MHSLNDINFLFSQGPEQYTLYAACDETLITVLKLLKVDIVVGVGRFAEKRAQTVIKTTGLPIKVPHQVIIIRKITKKN